MKLKFKNRTSFDNTLDSKKIKKAMAKEGAICNVHLTEMVMGEDCTNGKLTLYCNECERS